MNEKDVIKSLNLPFTTYDFLGYLAPGFALLTSIAAYEINYVRLAQKYSAVPEMRRPLSTIFSLIKPEKEDWMMAAALILCAVGVAYILGHVISSVSSFFLDRILLNRGYGYPYENLLDLPKTDFRREYITKPYYRAAYLYFNIGLLGCYISTIYLERIDAVVVLFAVLIPLFFLFFYMIIILKYKYCLSRRRNKKDKKLSEKFLTAAPLWGLCNDCHLFSSLSRPFDWGAEKMSHFLHTREPLNQTSIATIKERLQERNLIEEGTYDTNYFWMPYFTVLEHNERLSPYITNWLRLYSFNRNLSASFYIVYIYGMIQISTIVGELPQMSAFDASVLYGLPVFFLALSAVSLLRYYYLFVCYYTKSVYRIFLLTPTS